MITFYPGPSKVYPEVAQYIQEAFDSGVISANHRSESFMQMLGSAIAGLKEKLDVPADYEVYFVSSATECWEIIAQSLIREGSFHVHNGAFGEKWEEYTKKLVPDAQGYSFQQEELPDLNAFGSLTGREIVCLTHNETSNGTALPASFLQKLRNTITNLIAIDATSSMAGVVLPWQAADIWYASVQKCFGLPAGMGLLIVSPAAVARALEVGERDHYNSLLFIRDNFRKNQTPYTPNTLGIYLMDKVMQQVAPIQEVAANTANRAVGWYQFLTDHSYAPLIKEQSVRSETVIAVQDSKERISEIKRAAKAAGITLGNGYGKDKETTFRIANFPAISDAEILTLKEFLTEFAARRPNE